MSTSLPPPPQAPIRAAIESASPKEVIHKRKTSLTPLPPPPTNSRFHSLGHACAQHCKIRPSRDTSTSHLYLVPLRTALPIRTPLPQGPQVRRHGPVAPSPPQRKPKPLRRRRGVRPWGFDVAHGGQRPRGRLARLPQRLLLPGAVEAPRAGADGGSLGARALRIVVRNAKAEDHLDRVMCGGFQISGGMSALSRRGGGAEADEMIPSW